jgi:hypothetical protein
VANYYYLCAKTDKQNRAEEILALSADAATDNTDSPDIGPPPVSQFVDEDPVKIDLPVKDATTAGENLDLDTNLSLNLEQRRRRRSSSGSSEPKRASRFEPQHMPENQEPASLLKSGAKRKVSIRDDDDTNTVLKAPGDNIDDFHFTRKSTDEKVQSKSTTLSAEKAGGRVAREIASTRSANREKTGTVSQSSTGTRKALSAKSTNKDVQKSPSKRQQPKAPILDEIASVKLEAPKKEPIRDRQRRREDPSAKEASEPIVTAVEVEPDLEPETPAPQSDHLFSPTSTLPSTARPDGRDTPPPGELGTGEAHRPSRRARAAVSYAEPSLRDKMRRPGKELVDAVTGEGKSNHRLSSTKLEEPLTAVKIKAEPGTEAETEPWKTMPVAEAGSESPLVQKTMGANTEELANAITQRRRRISSMHQTEAEAGRASGGAISALLAGSRKIKSEIKDDDHLNRHDIYDFDPVSPPRKPDEKNRVGKENKVAPRAGRRHSSIPTHVLPEPLDPGERSDMEAIAKPVVRRRQSAIPAQSRVEPPSERAVRKAASGSIVAEATGDVTRTERVANRRRSMVL